MIRIFEWMHKLMIKGILERPYNECRKKCINKYITNE